MPKRTVIMLACLAPLLAALAAEPTPPSLQNRWSEPVEGVKLQLGFAQEVLGNVTGGVRQGAIYAGLVQAGIELDLERLAGWKGGTFLANALYAYGPSLTAVYVRDLNVLSNIDIYDSPRLHEVWLQQAFFEGRLSLRAGLLEADTDFIICDSATLFLNSAFGTSALFSSNGPVPTFPLTSPGALIAWKPTPSLTVRAAAYSGDVGEEAVNNRHAGRATFSNAAGGVYIAEIERRFDAGVLKVGGFFHTARFEDLSGRGTEERGLGSAYAIWDQPIYRFATEPAGKDKAVIDPDDNIRDVHFFARAGCAFPASRALIGIAAEAGFVANGPFAGREDDVAGIAIAYTRLGEDVHFLDGAPVTRHHELVLEATYQFALGEHLSLQPDVQVIFNPGATATADTAVVLGMRCTLTF